MPNCLQNRTIRSDLFAIALIGLLVQGLWALRLPHPSYFDAYYYTTNAQRLADGYGFTQEIIWQYLDAPESVPAPSFTYWMPLPAMIGAAGYAISDSFRAAQAPFWLMAGLLPWLAYAISWRLFANRRQAWTAALFTAAGGYYSSYFGQPTTFALFAWTGGGCLLALAWAQERATGRWWLLAGLAAGLSHLARADGVLLLLLGGWVWLLALRDGGLVQWRRYGGYGVAFVLGYLLVMGGWFWRTYQLTGVPLSTAGTQTIFLTTYDDVFSYGRSFDLQSYLAWGWGNILRSKLEAASLAAQTFVGVTGLTVFTFFFVWAWGVYGRKQGTGRFLRPFTWYTLGLYGAMTFVFTFPGQRGSLLHSSTALWPWSMALAVAGIDLAVDAIARRRPHWQPARAKRLFAGVFTLMVFVVSLGVSGGHPLREDEAAVFEEIAAVLPADALVMLGSPPNFYYHTGIPAIVVPNEPVDVLLAVAERYGANYLVLNADRPPILADLHDGNVTMPQIEEIGRFGETFVLYRLVE